MSSEERVGVNLKVTEAKQQRDIGRSIARIDSSAREALGVGVGDVIEIHGKKVTPAKAWPAYPEEQGLDLIRIDSFIRKNCGVSLSEYVTVKKAKFEYANYVTLAPIETRISVDNDFRRFMKDRLIDRPVTQGDTVLVMMLGHSILFMVVITWPSGIVKFSSNTEVDILGKPISFAP